MENKENNLTAVTQNSPRKGKQKKNQNPKTLIQLWLGNPLIHQLGHYGTSAIEVLKTPPQRWKWTQTK